MKNVVINNWCYAWDIDSKPPLMARREVPLYDNEEVKLQSSKTFRECKVCGQEFMQRCTELTCSNKCRITAKGKGE